MGTCLTLPSHLFTAVWLCLLEANCEINISCQIDIKLQIIMLDKQHSKLFVRVTSVSNSVIYCSFQSFEHGNCGLVLLRHARHDNYDNDLKASMNHV